MEIIELKAALRSKMRAYCKGIDAEKRRALSEKACERIKELPEFLSARYILSYMAMPNECDPAEAVRFAWKNGQKVVFPVCEEGNTLGLYLPAGADAFVRGKYGIMEPDTLRSVRISIEQIDCIIVPGLAFDRGGRRLGQGAGYYDRLLCESGAYRIALAFPDQIISEVPVASHDALMNAVVTAENCFVTNLP